MSIPNTLTFHLEVSIKKTKNKKNKKNNNNNKKNPKTKQN